MNNFDGSSFTIGIYADKDNAVTLSKIISALSAVDLHFANKIFTATTASEMPQLMNFDKPVEQVSHYIDESHKILYGLACWHPYFENVVVGLDQHANDNKGYAIRLSFDSDVLGIPVALRDEQDNDDALLFWSTATTIMTNLSVKLNACYAARLLVTTPLGKTTNLPLGGSPRNLYRNIFCQMKTQILIHHQHRPLRRQEVLWSLTGIH